MQEFQEDKPYIELCWEAEQDARFLLGMAGDRNSFIMRAEPVTTAEEGTRSPLGSPLKKSYMPKGEIKTKSIYSQVKNNRDTFLDNRASFLAYRPSKNDLVRKSSRNHKRLFTTILGKPTTPRRGRIPASRCKSDSEAYSYSQAYSTKTSPPDDGIDHLEDLRLTLLSWTTATHESFVGSSSLSCEELGRTSNDIGVRSEQHESVKREADRRYAPGTSPSATIDSGQRSRHKDIEGIDDEVARIMVCIQVYKLNQ